MKINKDGQIIEKVKWYDLKKTIKDQELSIQKDDILEKFYHEFSETIKLHLRSDVKLGLSLSGGLDSKIILKEVLQKHNIKNLNSYSFIFNEKYSEENAIIENIGNEKIKKLH